MAQKLQESHSHQTNQLRYPGFLRFQIKFPFPFHKSTFCPVWALFFFPVLYPNYFVLGVTSVFPSPLHISYDLFYCETGWYFVPRRTDSFRISTSVASYVCHPMGQSTGQIYARQSCLTCLYRLFVTLNKMPLVDSKGETDASIFFLLLCWNDRLCVATWSSSLVGRLVCCISVTWNFIKDVHYQMEMPVYFYFKDVLIRNALFCDTKAAEDRENCVDSCVMYIIGLLFTPFAEKYRFLLIKDTKSL